jgi:hypothetical protein
MEIPTLLSSSFFAFTENPELFEIERLQKK